MSVNETKPVETTPPPDTDLSQKVILPYKTNKEYTIDPVPTPGKALHYRFFKRLFDIVLSLLLLIVLFIPMVLCGIIVWATSKGTALYRQERLGLNGKPFNIIKFRTMVHNAEKDGAQWCGDDDERITPFGSFLRKSRLDELPQLWCILVGTMTFVGPRPEREIFYEEFETYIHGFRQRLQVKPGLTGLAQVNGGYELRPEEKILYDMAYIKHQSLGLDLKIFLQTFGIMFSHDGAK